MMIIVSYDVNTTDPAGRKRLRKISKICLDYGQRIQNSVFACKVDATKFEILKHRLLSEYREDCDSLYFFNLGSRYSNKMSNYGCKFMVNLDEPVIF